MIVVTVESLERTESRRAHYRTDYLETDPDWQRNIDYERADLGGMATDTGPIDEPNETISGPIRFSPAERPRRRCHRLTPPLG